MSKSEQVLLQAFLDPAATEEEVAGLFESAPFVVPPELMHPDGEVLLWQYVQLVGPETLSLDGLGDHRARLDACPGICVRWFDVATEDIDLKTAVRVFNLGHFGMATSRRGRRQPPRGMLPP
jgi:hypothetical protein